MSRTAKRSERAWFLVIATGLLIALVGCLPQRIVWSPDGSRALVIAGEDNDLYLCDPEGQLSSKLTTRVFRAAWLPDGQRAVLLRNIECGTWEELTVLMSEVQQEQLRSAAEALLAKVHASGDWESQVKPLLDSGTVEDDEVDAMKLYLRDMAKSRLPAGLLEQWGQFNRVGVWTAQLAHVGADAVQLDRVLLAALTTIWDARFALDGRSVAMVTGDPFDGPGPNRSRVRTQLWLVDLDTGTPARSLAADVALYPDWTPDGLSLVYARAEGPKTSSPELAIGSIIRQKVRDANGLLDKPGGTESLAGLLMSSMTRVRCLRDGRILFTSVEAQLPATTRDMPQHLQLFALDPPRQATVSRLVPRDSQSRLVEWADLFEVSPDEAEVAFLDDDGRVFRLELATGVMRVVQPEKCPRVTVPVWRKAGELCFARPLATPKEGSPVAEIVLLSKGPAKSLTTSWPYDVTKGLSDRQ